MTGQHESETRALATQKRTGEPFTRTAFSRHVASGKVPFLYEMHHAHGRAAASHKYWQDLNPQRKTLPGTRCCSGNPMTGAGSDALAAVQL